MSSASSDDFDDYLYDVVEFVKRGRPSSRTIDIVPLKWLSFNEKKKCMETKFKPPPYNEQIFKEIENLVESNADAPAEWPVYRVRVIARGRSYIEALKKLRLAQDQRYAFTTETDVEPEEKAAAIEREFKKKTLHKNVSEIKSLMNVKPIEPKVYKSGKKRNITSSSSIQPNSKYHKKSNKINYLDDDKENWNDREPKTMHQSNELDVPIDEPSTSKIILDVIAPVINENSINQFDDILFPDSELMDISFPKNVLTNEESQLKTQNLKQKDKKTEISFEHVEIMKAIEGINVVLKQVLENQNKIMNLWEVSGVLKSMPEAFHEKYKLNIPFKTIEEFINFNELLQSNNDCLRDFFRSLYVLIDRRRNYIKTITNILKKYMVRDVALRHTAQKQCTNKLVLKELPFCKSIIELAVHKLMNENNQPLTEKEILNGIGYCLTNAKDWDGHRAKRNKVQNPE